MRNLVSYRAKLLTELDDLAEGCVGLLDHSTVSPRNWDSTFIGFPHFYWAPSSAELQPARMELLARIKDVEPRVRLLFPHPSPEVVKPSRRGSSYSDVDSSVTTSDHSLPVP